MSQRAATARSGARKFPHAGAILAAVSSAFLPFGCDAEVESRIASEPGAQGEVLASTTQANGGGTCAPGLPYVPGQYCPPYYQPGAPPPFYTPPPAAYPPGQQPFPPGHGS